MSPVYDNLPQAVRITPHPPATVSCDILNSRSKAMKHIMNNERKPISDGKQKGKPRLLSFR